MQVRGSVITAALERSGVPSDEWQARLAETLRARPVWKISTQQRNRFPEDGASGWLSPKRWCSNPTSCCWMSPPITSDLAAIEWLEELLQSASLCVGCGQSRPLFPGERCHDHG